MGLSYLVYPGAHHTRFHHAIGCMHLMQKAVQVLRFKRVGITDAEEEALLAAILLHDIGHGPFSHAMEHTIVGKVNHEQISLKFMEALNEEFNGSLTVAIEIFNGKYPKKFMTELISSQLDMDRLDYLKRDSFYTGVAEGNINSERLITMLNVVDDHLVVEEKGIYSVEKFLVARRLMYWQAYLHKTSYVAEQLLIRALQRAKHLLQAGTEVPSSSALHFFMLNKVEYQQFTKKVLDEFSKLDDIDILSALKAWQNHPDFVLSKLSCMLLNRELLKIKVKDGPVGKAKIEELLARVSIDFNITTEEASYFVFEGEIENQAYNLSKQNIHILTKTGKLIDVAKASDQLNLEALSQPVTKYFICYPK